MTAILLAAMTITMSASNTQWADSVAFGEGGLTLPSAGNYGVWVFAPEDEAVSIKLGEQSFEAAKASDNKDRFSWRKIGEAALPAGPVKGSLGPNATAVAVSADAQFDPAKSLAGVRAWHTPDGANDRRATHYRDTHTYMVFPKFASREEWESHAATLRRRMLIGSGLLPMPERTPLNARVFDPQEHGDYIVEKVTFESRPGFLVTGNLYRPVGNGPFPAILNPHGHWKNGRLENAELGSVPGRCITFARMGIVAFSPDMVGYVDSKQLPHGFNKEIEKLWGVHNFAFQLWNNVRAVDFLQSLPYVDPERIGCTGASGGGTQTFALTAIDDRIKVAAPVNMISCSMQGGCPCENAPIIRFDGVSNMNIGALAAPRPLLMVAATGDWTVETPRVEFPAVRSIFELNGVPERIESTQITAEHNFNQPSREAVYRFFGKWLLNEPEKYANFTEPAFTLDPEAQRIFPGDAKPDAPSGDEIIKQTIDANRAKWQKVLPADAAGLDAFRNQYRPALADVFDAQVPVPNDLTVERPGRSGFHKQDGIVIENLIVHRASVGDAVPATLYRADDAEVRDAVLVVHGAGKAALADPDSGGVGELVRALLNEGKCVVAIDAFLLGEHQPLNGRVTRVQGAFPDTFEPTDTACRVQDVLTALAYLRSRRDLTGTVDLVGLGDGGMWSLFAAALDDGVRSAVVDANGFDNEDDPAWVARFYVPCIRSLGDVATAAALVTPRPLVIGNTAGVFKTETLQKAYTAGGGKCDAVAEPLTTAAIVEYLKSVS